MHASIASPYFFVPENSSLDDYWARVEDRLQKIRQSLNILGISQPVPLFSPPLDPMALVEAAASGAALDAAAAAAPAAIPHYRFAFLIGKAQDLTQALIDLGGELLLTLEKHDAEQLNLLQNRQEGVILAMTRAINEAQVRAATEDLAGLQASLLGAQGRVTHYQDLLDAGQTALELAQIGTMIEATVDHAVSTVLNIGAAIAHVVPNVTVGLFSFGAQEGGENAGGALGAAAAGTESAAGVASGVAEVLGVYASFLRTTQDWQLQLSLAQADVDQITHQVNAATEQLTVAQQQLGVLNQQIVHNDAVTAFMTGKFSSAQLYQWMSGKLAGLYFQAYHLAYEMARSAERALWFERGLRDGGPDGSLIGSASGSYIRPLYWESQRNGLLAGESLQADLQRLDQAYRDANVRGLEITKQISLLTLDPVALLRLKSTGVAEFALTEELFDRDFPGHFRRQIRTLSVGFADANGQPLSVNAMLTQTGHKTLLEADPKAVKYLLDSSGPAPATLRSDWQANQQIALSDTDGQQDSNGLFELNFDDDRYLPFEGTGAVSTWRLEATGRGPANRLDNLQDVVLTLKYTAAPGGEIFASAITGMLRPYPAARFFDVATDFAQQWQQFAASSTADLALTFTPDMFPGMSSRQITGVFATYAVANPQGISFVLNGDTDWTLAGGKLVSTPGLNLTGSGSTWTFTPTGDRSALTDIGLVLTYTAAAR